MKISPSNPYKPSVVLERNQPDAFAQRWRWITAAVGTLSRLVVWALLFYLAVMIVPAYCAFALGQLGVESGFLHFTHIWSLWLQSHLGPFAGLLIVLLGVDLVVRLQPDRGPVARWSYFAWNYCSLWLPITLAVVYTIGLFLPLMR